jgi:hypothetical protein
VAGRAEGVTTGWPGSIPVFVFTLCYSSPSPALPDDGFLRQICKILADLKVIWQAKNISGGLPISGGFLVDLINLSWVCFCLADLADSGSFGVSMSKKQLASHLFWQKKIN